LYHPQLSQQRLSRISQSFSATFIQAIFDDLPISPKFHEFLVLYAAAIFRLDYFKTNADKQKR